MTLFSDIDIDRYGFNVPLAEFQERLSAATAFASLRKEVERRKLALESLKALNFKKRHAKDFENNVNKLCCEDDHELLALLSADCIDKSQLLNLLILALLFLNPTLSGSISSHNLSAVLAEFLVRRIGDCSIYPETRLRIVELLRQLCSKYTTEASRKVYELLPPSASKKRKLASDIGEADRLVLRAESLVLPELNSGDSAPNLSRERPPFQFTAARGDKLAGTWPAFYQAVRTARQWCWERQKDAGPDAGPDAEEERTDCIVALMPENDNEDISFVFRVGFKAGWEILQYLEFRSTNDSS